MYFAFAMMKRQIIQYLNKNSFFLQRERKPGIDPELERKYKVIFKILKIKNLKEKFFSILKSF